MDGAQIGHSQSAIELLTALAVFAGVFQHGQGYRQPLVSAAGVDDHGHFTAAHARVAAGGGLRAGAHAHIAAVGIQQHVADIRAPSALESLGRDGGVAFDLPVQHVANVIRV